MNGEWESGEVYVAPAAGGSEERLTAAELEQRVQEYMGPFRDRVGTLVGEITFADPTTVAQRRVRFYAHVYLDNQDRRSVLRPPSYKYEAALEAQGANYQRRVQISHELKQGETDRFTVKVAVPQSSSHRFQATVRDITGSTWASLPIEMNCFVPRSRRERVNNALAPPQQ